MRWIQYLKRALQAYRIACLEAEYQGHREDFYRLAQQLTDDRKAIASAQQRFTELGGYIPSDYQVGAVPIRGAR